MRARRWLPWIGFALAALWPALALACPVCGGGGGESPRTQAAFFNTTVLLSLLPLGLIGGGVWWLKRDARDWLGGEFEDRDAFSITPEAREAPSENAPAE
jgi:high-affinity Fe2+/Pb2+ permease